MHWITKFFAEKKTLFIRAVSIAVPLTMALLFLSQTAFAQTTYVITDGSRVLVHTTTESDPAAVLDEAGLTLDADDTYTTQAADGVAEINIRRSQTIYIDYYGEALQAETPGETVSSLLTRLNLTWSRDDAISQSLDAPTYDGMEIAVAHVLNQNQTYTAMVPHETIYCSDATLSAGQEVVLTEGVDGELTCTATVTYINGVETERKILSQDITRQPVDEVIAVGTARSMDEASADAPIIGNGTITLPTGEVLTYTEIIRSYATAYCDKGLTATGTQARVGAIAVDPDVIPYGTRMFIVSEDGEYIYGIATAEDTGNPDFIHGTRIDLHYDTWRECIDFGERYCQVYLLG